LAFSGIAVAQPSSGQPYPVIQGKTYKFQRIADGVYYTTGGLGSNNVVIVNDADVMLVDTGISPAAARKFIADVKMLTNKPIRYVVNTHWHYDHTDGNQAFGPDVKIMATEYVRNAMASFDVLNREPFLGGRARLVAQADTLQQQADAETDKARKADLNKRLKDTKDAVTELKEIKVTPPNVTYTDRLTVHAGSREIDLMFLGRGHTGGDTVVYLPKEKIVCTGDLMESQLAYMGDAFFDEWIVTLDKLKALDFDVDLPGHGVPFGDKGHITAFQSYLTDLMKQAGALRGQGVPAEEAARRVDMTAHAKDFPQITGPGADVRGVRHLYAWMDETGKR
jgi:glyoxylase-like metal-dependent hydrolase (beta-lactamase superfamily II)